MVLGWLLLAALRPAAGQEAAADRPPLRTWTDSSGQHQTEAVFVGALDGEVVLKKKDGSIVSLRLEKLSQADQEYVKSRVPGKDRPAEAAATPPPVSFGAQPGGSNGPGRGSVVEVNNLGGTASAASPAAQGREVVVTGTGADADKAVQNAFSQAIEQTVGVLVDAETVVKNDQLIRDEILTYSRGYVQDFNVLRKWKEGGLHYAQIKATVAVSKLVEKLKASNVAVRDMPGELMSRQAEHEVTAEHNAASMFRTATDDFRVSKLWTVQIEGMPEVVEKDETHARIRIQSKLSADAAKWSRSAERCSTP